MVHAAQHLVAEGIEPRRRAWKLRRHERPRRRRDRIDGRAGDPLLQGRRGPGQQNSTRRYCKDAGHDLHIGANAGETSVPGGVRG